MNQCITGRLAALVLCAFASIVAPSAALAQAGGFDGNNVWRPDPGPGNNAWTTLTQFDSAVLAGEANIRPDRYRALVLDEGFMAGLLATAPLELTGGQPVMVTVPMPDGTDAVFDLVRTQVLHPDLQAQYPMITTYSGTNRTPGPDYGAPGFFDLTPLGFHGSVRAPSGTIYIDPVTKGDTKHYVSYYIRDHKPAQVMGKCEVTDDVGVAVNPHLAQRRTGPTRRQYRLAIACTAEYTAANGGTVTAALANVTTTLNRVIAVYLPEFTITFQLVANETSVIFTNGTTDGLTNTNNSTTLGEITTVLNTAIGSGNYDIGHCFTTTGGGIATLGGVCGANKARGVSGSIGVNDWFTTFTVAHEMGHQFNANHTFNTTDATCNPQRAAASAYEPGGGSTLMAYPVQCGADAFVSQGDFYFHSDAFDRVIAYVAAGGACSSNAATGNLAPTIAALTNRSAPLNTPFELNCNPTDANGDALTVTWEQRSLGAAISLAAGDNGSSPIIRSRPGTSSPLRPIPATANLLVNTLAPAEILPTVARTITFRATARDNRVDGGGVNTADVNITFVNTGAAFAVTSPNGGETLSSGTPTNVTWNVAGTTASPISTSQVQIKFSTDGGNTFPTSLGTFPNNGSASVTLPNVTTSTARIRVEAVNNVYLDISNANFTVKPAVTLTSTGKIDVTDTVGLGNDNGNGRVDPGEDTVQLFFQVRNDGAGTATGVTGTLTSSTPTVTVTTGAASFPNLGAGVTGFNTTPFVISVSSSHVCGDPIALTLTLNSAQGGGSAVPTSLGTGGANQPYSFVYSGVTPIPDNSPAGVEIPLTVSDLGGLISVVRLNIDGTVCSTDPSSTTVGLAHQKVSDLIITLIAPDNTSSIMVNRPGGLANLGTNMCNTQFKDDNTVPILTSAATTVLAPYSGAWRPSQAMSRFANRNPNGTWKLRVADNAAGSTGTVYGFTLTIVTQGVACDPPVGAACNLADITEIGGTAEAPGNPDGQLTVDDIIVFTNLYSDGTGCPGAAPCSRADVTGIGGAGAPPDGQLTVDDIIEFFNAFSDGCP